MQALRRGGVNGLPNRLLLRRNTWQSLAPFAAEQQQQAAWQQLRDRAHAVQMTVERMQGVAATEQQKKPERREINWKDWDARISHKALLGCLKSFHAAQLQLLDAAAAAARKEAAATGEKEQQFGREQQQGWKVYDETVAACKTSVAHSEELLSNGARALWVSHRNPPLTRVDTNEWLDSDLYWQAFVEKHHFYSQYQPGTADPEAPEEREGRRKAWHSRMQKFNERSDTPMLFDYMTELPSWEFYDINRSAFLEHMLYFLTRTGGDFRFFPQLPPWQWISHIEQLRYNFLRVAQQRRAELQLQQLERERPLDFLPLDIAHEGEAAVMKLLQHEKRLYELLTARLMNHYMFCCGPFVPVQSEAELQDVVQADGSRGKLYSLGEDVRAVFYLPLQQQNQQQQHQQLRPMHALAKLLTHMQMTGRCFNPCYTELLRIHMEVLEQRGDHWFTAPGECASQAFLRRLRTDDPAFSVYTTYVEEMYSRFAAAEEISPAAAVEKLRQMQPAVQEEKRLFALLLQQQSADSPYTGSSSSHDAHGGSKEELEEQIKTTAPANPEAQPALRQEKRNAQPEESPAVVTNS